MNVRKTAFKSAPEVIKKAFAYLSLFVAGMVVFSLTSFYLIPLTFFEDRLKETLKERSGLIFRSESLERVFPFGLEAKGVDIGEADGGRLLLHLDRVRIRAILSALVIGKMKAGIDGGSADGSFEGEAALSGGGAFAVKGKGIDFSSVPALNTAGVSMKGTFDADLYVFMKDGCPEGFLELKGARIDEGSVRFRGYPLPLGKVDGVGLSADFSRCAGKLNGFWLNGEDASVSLKGDISIKRPLSSSPVDLTLELTPKAGLLEKEFLLLLLKDYKKSANFYSIPVKGTIGKVSAE